MRDRTLSLAALALAVVAIGVAALGFRDNGQRDACARLADLSSAIGEERTLSAMQDLDNRLFEECITE